MIIAKPPVPVNDKALPGTRTGKRHGNSTFVLEAGFGSAIMNAQVIEREQTIARRHFKEPVFTEKNC